MRAWSLPLPLVFLACITSPSMEPMSIPAAPMPESPPSLRLPTDPRPLAMHLTMGLSGKAARATGDVRIDLFAERPHQRFWVHGVELEELSVVALVRGATIAVEAHPLPSQELLELRPALALEGNFSLHFRYTAAVHAKDDAAIFHEQSDAQDYVFTQFEATAARRAFPCFDEPSFKIPWEISLEVPKEELAFSNMPIEETVDLGARRRVRFAKTPPLPAYLVAFAVGPFEVIDAGLHGQKRTPVRMIVPAGHREEARYAVAHTGSLLERLERYFDLPYPYAKLDLLVVPELVTFAAMEHPGLVTIGGGFALAKGSEDTIPFQRTFLEFTAHELAHQWFGDLVTLSWWDEVWLNESFAEWLGHRIAHEEDPSMGLAMAILRDSSLAMQQDALSSARKIRQEISGEDDIENAFDTITYEKGGAVIAMFERYLSPARFRRGVRTYLTSYPHGNAGAAEFLSSLSRGAERDVTAAFSSFLDQAGVPVVAMRLESTPTGPLLAVRQSRRRLLASGQDNDPHWRIPLCVRYGNSKAKREHCTLLETRTASVALLSLEDGQPPTWLVPNAGGAGYYQSELAPEALSAIFEASSGSTEAERFTAVRDLGASVDAGHTSITALWALLPRLAKDPSPEVRIQTAELLRRLPIDFFAQPLRAKLAAELNKLFGPEARSLGFSARRGEGGTTSQLRASLVSLAANLAHDPTLVTEAQRLGAAWLKKHAGLDAEAIDLVLATMVRHNGGSFLAVLIDQAQKEQDPAVRRHLLSAFSSVHDPALTPSVIGLALSEGLDAREALALFDGAPTTAKARWDFLRDHADQVLARLPLDAGIFVLGNLRGICREPDRVAVEGELPSFAARIRGGPRIAAQVQESAAQCVALVGRIEPELAAALLP